MLIIGAALLVGGFVGSTLQARRDAKVMKRIIFNMGNKLETCLLDSGVTEEQIDKTVEKFRLYSEL